MSGTGPVAGPLRRNSLEWRVDFAADFV